jgi:beta-lactamase regulating signal transducer with metallopeptidase domain
VSRNIALQVFEGLTRIDNKNTPQPAIAKSWTISKDRKTYLFTLRDAYWTNGTPVTAYDFEYAWKRSLSPELAASYAYHLYYVYGGEAFNTAIANVAAQQQAPVTASVSLIQIAAIIWLAGVFIYLIYHLIGFILFKKSVYHWCRPVKSSQDIDTFHDLLLELNIQRPIRIVSCRKLSSPMMFGILKPVIILPDVKFNKDELTLTLKHELIHYKHHDIAYKIIIVLAQSLYWFNPVVPLMARESIQAMEKYCDDGVVQNKDMLYRESYSEAILSVMKATQNRTTVFSTYFHVYGGHKTMKDRFANILNMSTKKKGITAAILILSFMILSGMLVACNSTTATFSSPVEVVTQRLTAEKNNDVKALYATLTADHKSSKGEKLGVTSLNIIEVKEETNSKYMEETLAGEEAKDNGWSEDNLTFVSATYDVQFDNKLVPNMGGRKDEVFKLLRIDKNSPWLIKDSGDARFK